MGTVQGDTDKTFARVEVQVEQTRDLGAVTTLLPKIIKRHKLNDFAIIERF
jgi:hypothetical protein